jgi:Zn-dependent oligopeptidase
VNKPLTSAEAAAYDPETVLVGSKLLMDMEKAGIHLPHASRLRMQELMNKNQHFGMAFNSAVVSVKALPAPHPFLFAAEGNHERTAAFDTCSQHS